MLPDMGGAVTGWPDSSLLLWRHRVGPGRFSADYEFIAARDGVSIGGDGIQVAVVVVALDATIIIITSTCYGEGAVAA